MKKLLFLLPILLVAGCGAVRPTAITHVFVSTDLKPIKNCYEIGADKKEDLTMTEVAYAILMLLSKTKTDHSLCQHYAEVKIGNEEMTYWEFLNRIKVNYQEPRELKWNWDYIKSEVVKPVTNLNVREFKIK